MIESFEGMNLYSIEHALGYDAQYPFIRPKAFDCVWVLVRRPVSHSMHNFDIKDEIDGEDWYL